MNYRFEKTEINLLMLIGYVNNMTGNPHDSKTQSLHDLFPSDLTGDYE